MGFSNEKVSITLTKDELLDLFLGRTITIYTHEKGHITLHGVNNHQPVPGMIEGESTMHRIETCISIDNQDIRATGMLKMDRGGHSYTGTFDYQLYPDNLSE